MKNNYYLYFFYILTLSCFSFSPQFVYANVELYLSSGSSPKQVSCNYIKIQDTQLLCTMDKLVTIYELEQIKQIGAVKNGELLYYNNFTQRNINEINTLGSKAAAEKLPVSSKLTPQGIVNRIIHFFTYLKIKYQKLNPSDSMQDAALLIGTILVLIGSIWFVITTFRAGILWGLSCLFLPIVSVVFLFVHWREAMRPVSLSIFGLLIAVLPSFFVTGNFQ